MPFRLYRNANLRVPSSLLGERRRLGQLRSNRQQRLIQNTLETKNIDSNDHKCNNREAWKESVQGLAIENMWLHSVLRKNLLSVALLACPTFIVADEVSAQKSDVAKSSVKAHQIQQVLRISAKDRNYSDFIQLDVPYGEKVEASLILQNETDDYFTFQEASAFCNCITLDVSKNKSSQGRGRADSSIV